MGKDENKKTDSYDFGGFMPSEEMVDTFVGVRNTLNDAYGEEYVTRNPVLIAAAIVSEAIYYHSSVVQDLDIAISGEALDTSNSIDKIAQAIYDTRMD